MPVAGWGGVPVPHVFSHLSPCNKYPALGDIKPPPFIVVGSDIVSSSCLGWWLCCRGRLPSGSFAGPGLAVHRALLRVACPRWILGCPAWQQGGLRSCCDSGYGFMSPPQGGPGSRHRGVHPLLRWLLCGHLCAGHRRPAQRQHHDPRERAGAALRGPHGGRAGHACLPAQPFCPRLEGEAPPSPSAPCPSILAPSQPSPFSSRSSSTSTLATFWGTSRPSLESTVSESHSSSPMTSSM